MYTYIYIDIPINMEPTLPSDNVKPGFPSPFLMGDDLRHGQVFEPKASGAWYLHRCAGMFLSAGIGMEGWFLQERKQPGLYGLFDLFSDLNHAICWVDGLYCPIQGC